MKRHNWMRSAVVAAAALAVMWCRTDAQAQTAQTPEQLNADSVAACEASAKDKATPQLIMSKVNEACALIEKEGKAAFPKFKGKTSAFLFAGTYIWVNDMKGTMLMHPIKYKMEGTNVFGLEDSNGKKMFVEFVDVCQKAGAGWVEYLWPKPGEKEAAKKVSYVKKAKCDGEDVVVGCGVYGLTMDEINKAAGK